MPIRKLSPVLQQRAIDELNEDPKRIEEDLAYIGEWLEKQKYLTVNKDDQHLVAFLRGCKFSLQRTKEKLDYFYSCRTLVPEFFRDRDPLSEELQEILKAGAVVKLPERNDTTETPIVFFRWDVCRHELMSLNSILKLHFMTIDIIMNEDDNMIVSGVRVVIDHKGLPLKYLLQFTPTTMQHYMMCLQKAYPIRLKGFYCINIPTAYETIYQVIKPLMTDKFKNRFFVYTENDIDRFYKDIDRTIMPKEYGGENGSLTQIGAEWKRKVEEYREWFQNDSHYGSNESLRPPQSEFDPAALFGSEGTFRKINVD